MFLSERQEMQDLCVVAGAMAAQAQAQQKQTQKQKQEEEEEEESFAKRVDRAFGSLGVSCVGRGDGTTPALSASASASDSASRTIPTWRVREELRRPSSGLPRSGEADEDEEEEDEEGGFEDEDDESDETLQEPPALSSSSSSSSREFRLLAGTDGRDRMDTGEMEEDLEEEGRQMRSMIGLDCTLDFEVIKNSLSFILCCHFLCPFVLSSSFCC